MEEHTKEGYFIAVEIPVECCVAEVHVDVTGTVKRLGREKETHPIFARTNFSVELKANLCGLTF